MRWLALLVAAGLVLAGCGSSNAGSSGANTVRLSAKAQIQEAYAKFFSGKTSVVDREAVLQDGQKFKSVIQSFASNPLAKNVSVEVSSVKLEGQDKANVVYTVKLGGAGLPKQTGTAVLQNGSWKVGDASLCRLVSLQGSTPSVCKS